jgi:hypothetical protein
MAITRVGGPKALEENQGDSFRWQVKFSERLKAYTRGLLDAAGAELRYSGALIQDFHFNDGDDAGYFEATKPEVPRWLEAIDGWLAHVSAKMLEDKQLLQDQQQEQQRQAEDRQRRLRAATEEFKDK